MKPAAFALVLAVVGGAVGYYLYVSRNPVHDPGSPDDPVQVAQGAALYAKNCATCHGEKLQGEPNWQRKKPDGNFPAPPHDATGHTWHHADSILFATTKQGGISSGGFRSAMPPFGATMSDADIWAVLAYIKKQWPPDIREKQAAITRRDEARRRPEAGTTFGKQ